MTEWLMSANAKKYNHQRAFDEQGFIYWRQTRNFSKGDIIFIYCTRPIGKIQYMAEVEETDIPMKVVLSDKKYYSNPHQQKEGCYIKLSLKKTYLGPKMDANDLSRFHFRPPQGPQRLKDSALSKYINVVFKEAENG